MRTHGHGTHESVRISYVIKKLNSLLIPRTELVGDIKIVVHFQKIANPDDRHDVGMICAEPFERRDRRCAIVAQEAFNTHCTG